MIVREGAGHVRSSELVVSGDEVLVPRPVMAGTSWPASSGWVQRAERGGRGRDGKGGEKREADGRKGKGKENGRGRK